MSRSSSALKSVASTRNIILFCVAWALLSLIFFLLFSVPPPGQEHPIWYLYGITFLETGAFAIALALCFRNFGSSQIVSGRGVWLSLSLGLLCYALGNILFFLWGNIWGLDQAVSLGDFLYIFSYVFLILGMLRAVLPRRLNLTAPQWLIIAGVGFLGVALAIFVNYFVVAESADLPAQPLMPAAYAQASPPVQPGEGVSPGTPEIVAPATDPSEDPNAATTAPDWVITLDSYLSQYEDAVGWLYVIGDCVLVVIAATLLVAFWGGRFSQSWKLIAIAAFCLYIADMFFAYQSSLGKYEEGALWEVFWTFSAIFFAIGAAVEYAVSTQSRRSSRRRRG
ncbi:MAG: hypothetical protein HC886_13585 [Leptolyngbyaceae cyanobacterium SM1_1_3]|nr:hypothetical protein [Leptolyngbyaceae cyanobacterium SM1_1_3]NJO10924.1 hypothetical protein [Leptolyngbyaceae cyanobacterium SL_1_1]